jgi:transcriptional regulator with XRE-family HTH domain
MPGYLSVPTHVEAVPTCSLVSNRLRDILVHVPYYTIQGRARLASDCNVSRSTISRLLNKRRSISFQLATKIANALSMRSGRLIEPQEIFALGGSYPTASACELMGCRGCLPPSAWDEQALSLRPGWNNALPSQWSNLVGQQPGDYVNETGDLCPLTESQATGASSLPKIQC